jgi:hypothetical protein
VPAFIGIVLCIVAAIAELAQCDPAANSAVGTALIVALLLLGCARNSPWSHWRALAHLDRVHAQIARKYNQQGWVQMVSASSLPVAIGDQTLFAQASFYWPDSLKQRLWYPTDLALSARYPAAVTEQLNLLRAGTFVSFPTIDWTKFYTANPHFLLVVYSSQDAWLPIWLAHQPRNRVKIEMLGPDFPSIVTLNGPKVEPTVYDIQILSPVGLQASVRAGP